MKGKLEVIQTHKFFLAVELILFDLLTSRLHRFKVRQFDDTNEISPKLYFFFDGNNVLKKVRIE